LICLSIKLSYVNALNICSSSRPAVLVPALNLPSYLPSVSILRALLGFGVGGMCGLGVGEEYKQEHESFQEQNPRATSTPSSLNSSEAAIKLS
jgi:hypothetical protein